MKNYKKVLRTVNFGKIALICYLLFWFLPTLVNYRLDVLHIGLENKESFYDPNSITFLVGNGVSKIFQYLIIWLLPLWIYFIFLKKYSDIFRQDVKYLYIFRKRNYVRKTVLHSVLKVFIITLIISMSSYIFTMLLFKGGTDTIYGQTYQQLVASTHKSFLTIKYLNPMLSNLVYLFIFSVVSSLLTFYILLISLKIEEERLLIIYMLVPWFIAVISLFSIVDIFQVFSEHTIKYEFMAFLKFNILYVIIIFYLFNIRSEL